MEHHELAGLFPAMDDIAFAKFKADIASVGQLNPIILFEGKVLDGVHRLRACEELGLEPHFEMFEGDRDLAHLYVLSQNLHRRHLDKRQQAAILAELPVLTPEEATARRDYRPTANGQSNDRPLPTTEELAKGAGVSPSTLTRARKTMRENPEEHARAKAGKPKSKAGRRDKAGPKHPLWVDSSASTIAAVKEMAEAEGKTLIGKMTEVVDAAVAKVGDTLAPTAREKLETAIRVRTKQLEAEFERRVRAEVTRLKKEMIIPKLEEDLKMAKVFFAGRLSKPLMSKADYKNIRMALHPDNIAGVETRVEAFRAFEAIDPSLLYSEEAEVRAARIAERLRTLRL